MRHKGRGDLRGLRAWREPRVTLATCASNISTEPSPRNAGVRPGRFELPRACAQLALRKQPHLPVPPCLPPYSGPDCSSACSEADSQRVVPLAGGSYRTVGRSRGHGPTQGGTEGARSALAPTLKPASRYLAAPERQTLALWALDPGHWAASLSHRFSPTVPGRQLSPARPARRSQQMPPPPPSPPGELPAQSRRAPPWGHGPWAQGAFRTSYPPHQRFRCNAYTGKFTGVPRGVPRNSVTARRDGGHRRAVAATAGDHSAGCRP